MNLNFRIIYFRIDYLCPSNCKWFHDSYISNKNKTSINFKDKIIKNINNLYKINFNEILFWWWNLINYIYLEDILIIFREQFPHKEIFIQIDIFNCNIDALYILNLVDKYNIRFIALINIENEEDIIKLKNINRYLPKNTIITLSFLNNINYSINPYLGIIDNIKKYYNIDCWNYHWYIDNCFPFNKCIFNTNCRISKNVIDISNTSFEINIDWDILFHHNICKLSKNKISNISYSIYNIFIDILKYKKYIIWINSNVNQKNNCKKCISYKYNYIENVK